jgi:hypothetical protein
MNKYSFDASRGERLQKRPARNWLRGGLIVLAIVLMTVLYDFSHFDGNVKDYLPGLREKSDKGTKRAFPPRQDAESGKDIVVTKKDLQETYKDLLQKKEKDIESVALLEAEKGSYYQVDLATGRALTAVTIQLDKKMAMITDSEGMVISIERKEISGIQKIAVKANP